MKHFHSGFGHLATVTRSDLAAGRNELGDWLDEVRLGRQHRLHAAWTPDAANDREGSTRTNRRAAAAAERL